MRDRPKTLDQLRKLAEKFHPWENLKEYIAAAGKVCLSGVHEPFWHDWALADPSTFLTLEPLHHWHKGFCDHDVKWCINIAGAAEINFRFAILHPHTGFRHFSGGISQLKQVTGREHRDLQRYIIGLVAGTVPKEALIALRSLMDFRYLAQAPVIDNATCVQIKAALSTFHDHKASIIKASGRRRKKKKIIDNWYIPKLEFMQSVAPSITDNGVAIQWSADITEQTNNQEYEAQICQCLDRQDKCRCFDLATALHEAKLDLSHITTDADYNDGSNLDGEPLHKSIDPLSHLVGTAHRIPDYFEEASLLQRGLKPNARIPFHAFAAPQTAFHLNWDPSSKRSRVDAISAEFGILVPLEPDLGIPDRFLAYMHRLDITPQLNPALSGS